MNQNFTIGDIRLIEDEEGFGVAENTTEGFVVIASFKYPLDALKYFTEYSIYHEELEAIKTRTENTNE